MNQAETSRIIDYFCDESFRIPGGYRGVLIGDVLKKTSYTAKGLNVEALCLRWERCGIDLSLQEIVEESKGETVCDSCLQESCLAGDICCENYKKAGTVVLLANENAVALFSFLATLISKKK